MSPAKKTTAQGSPKVFSDFEMSAMRARANELRVEAKASKNKAAGLQELLISIAKMPEPDRSLAKKVHNIIITSAPSLWPKTWYGMPAYADKDGKVVCFFQNASKFKYRYSTLGFQDSAQLDDGNMWPVVFALKKITPVEETKIAALVKKAVR
jgi:uncharacterized protein YdhG (YjbR/CyaY superfamily)